MIKNILKIAIGLGLLAVLLLTVDLGETFSVLKTISWEWVIALFAVSFILVAISCVKWQMFLRVRGIDVSYGRLFSLYIMGYFFNNFTLGNVGGDFIRGAMLGGHIQSNSESFGSIFLERFTGFLALIMMALFGVCFRPELRSNGKLMLLMACMFIAFVGFWVVLSCKPMQALMLKVFDKFEKHKLVAKLKKFTLVIFDFPSNKPLVIKAMALSVLFHLMTVVNTQAACMSLGIPVNFWDLVVLVPVVLLLAALPFSFNSIGIMEGAMVYFLGMAGVPPPEALSVALVLRAKNIVLAILGGFLLLGWKLRKPEAESSDV